MKDIYFRGKGFVVAISPQGVISLLNNGKLPNDCEVSINNGLDWMKFDDFKSSYLYPLKPKYKPSSWESYIMIWGDIFNFCGRLSRGQFWWFHVGNYLVSLASGGFISFLIKFDDLKGSFFLELLLLFINVLWWILFILANISVGIKRLHDLNKASYWMLLVFVPLIGWSFLFSMFLTKGENIYNKYNWKY